MKRIAICFSLVMALAITATAVNPNNRNSDGPKSVQSNITKRPLYYNPGPVQKISIMYAALPKDVKNFINKHYKQVTVKSCMKNVYQGGYEVTLVNGIIIEFDHSNNWTEIRCSNNAYIEPRVSEKLLPRKVLKSIGNGHINQIRKSNNSYSVNTNGNNRMDFDKKGKSAKR